jgi:predicted metal-dependent phosphoesterase TrpH
MIDLHTHTDQSDGSVPPHRLVYEALALGLEALAITDHDTLAGYDLAAPVAAEAGLELLCGIELSTRLEQKVPGPRMPSVHLLGYFTGEPPSAGFREWLRQQQESRRKRNLALIAKLRSLGVDITLEEVQALGRNLTGRPHFARVLVSKGYVANSQEAFDVYLADHARAAVEREEPTLIEGIRHIRAGGGLPSLAHPVRLPQRDASSLRALLEELCEAGLQGIEVYHSEHSHHDTELYLELASEFGLAATGGSDFHGENKPSIYLGSGRKNNLHLPYALLEQIRAAQASARSQRAPAT